MTGGMRVAGAAMSLFAARHDVISHNLANVSTPGYARQDTFLSRLEPAGAAPFQAPVLGGRIAFESGPPILTGVPAQQGARAVRTLQVSQTTYQLVLLPVWIAVLHSPTGRSMAWINGQTGTVLLSFIEPIEDEFQLLDEDV